ncbi:MAG: hypothetical protein M0D57_10985 [Sphingobacteriales bacterium JAD_PAG50586_3]|nr:MAG: hypothetical protein M0D57_10985 [Sphingobacteriales bacterium JAD_PAG50586_3]
MKFTKILVVVLAIASFLFGMMLNSNNKEIADKLTVGALDVAAYPPVSEFTTGASAAFATGGFALVLALLAFQKNKKMLVAFALFTIIALIASYYLQPEYTKIPNGPATSKELALIQLLTGNIAAFAAILFARQQQPEKQL